MLVRDLAIKLICEAFFWLSDDYPLNVNDAGAGGDEFRISRFPRLRTKRDKEYLSYLYNKHNKIATVDFDVC